MFVPAWALRVAPYVGGLLLAVAAYAWAYGNGKEAERAKWQKREAAAVEAAQAKERALQAQVDAAGVALSERSTAVERIREKAQTITRTYYVANPSSNVACLDDGRVQHITQSDAAAIGNPAAAK
jgi:small ligand-binding sensory domain FIST